MKHIRRIFEDEKTKPKTGGVSNEWKANCIRLIKKGKTLNDESLSKMGKNSTIAKYFPTADPNWKPKKKDVEKYILKNPKVKEKILNKANVELAKQSGQYLANTTWSYKMPSYGVVDLGYLNIKYSVYLESIKLTGFSGENFKGKAVLKIKANVPDGILKGLSTSTRATTNVTVGYTPTLGEKNVNAKFTPKAVVVNTSKFSAGGSLTLFAALSLAVGLVAASFLTYNVKFYVKNNDLRVNLGTILGMSIGDFSIWKIPVLSYVKKALGSNTKFSVPRESLRISSTPNSPEEVKKTAYTLLKSVNKTR